MAKYASKDVVIEVDNASGALVDISQYVDSIGDISIEAVLEESETFGDSWAEKLFAQFRTVADLALSGRYDDTAAKVLGILDDVGNVLANSGAGGARTFKVTYGSTKTTSIECFVKSFKRSPKLKGITRFECVLSFSGAPTEA